MKVAERNESGQTSKLLAITDSRLRINNARMPASWQETRKRSRGAPAPARTPALPGTILVNVLVSPIVAAGPVVLCFDLRAREEGPGAVQLEAQPAFQP
jgi:hypothetical protein